MPEQANPKPTLKSIAAVAGVHPSTASRALADQPGSRIPQTTIDRVRRAAESLGYEVDPWARSLRTGRSMMLGLAIPRITDVVLAEMFEAAQERARSHGYETITVASFDRPEAEASLVNSLVERRVDGVILATARVHDEVLDMLVRRNYPFVLLNRASGSHPVVRGDDELGGYLATRHLLTLGHRRIGHIAGPEYVSTSRDRLAGYRRALEEHGIPYDPTLVGRGRFDATSALTVAKELLGHEDPPTAIFAINDMSAIAAMATAHANGLRVPDDVAVVGYNDSEVSRLLPIPLTTMRYPLTRMGELAVDLLVARLAGDPVEPVVLSPELIVRSSSARPVGQADAQPARRQGTPSGPVS